MKKSRFAWIGLLLALSACRPVFAVGWGELVVLIVIVAVLLGPILFRVFRFWETYRRRMDTHKDQEG